MRIQHVILIILLLMSSVTIVLGQEKTQKSFTLFKHIIRDQPDAKYFHPWPEDKHLQLLIFSVQEGKLLRVGIYGLGGSQAELESRFHFVNNTGKNLSRLPATYRISDEGALQHLLFGENGEYQLAPYVPANSKKIGTREEPDNMTWRRVWKNYYIITVYKGTKVVTEDLAMEEKGKDVYSILGESNENPPADSPGFTASWLGDEVVITPILRPNGPSGSYRMMLLDNESPLPPDFPKDLIKWIP